MSLTLKNLEGALAGESMAHVKYLYFARLARAEGHEEVAQHFEHTAAQELKHAWGHLELLVGKPSTNVCLQLAIDGETYEYTEMYPRMEEEAEREGNEDALLEARLQAAESRDHANKFAEILAKAQKRFAALKRVEQRHAEAYQYIKEKMQ
jgi:rubrerythrin